MIIPHKCILHRYCKWWWWWWRRRRWWWRRFRR